MSESSSSCVTKPFPIATGLSVTVKDLYSFDILHPDTARDSLITAILTESCLSQSKLNELRNLSSRLG